MEVILKEDVNKLGHRGDVVKIAEYMTAAVVVGAVIALIGMRWLHHGAAAPAPERTFSDQDKMTWRMPQLALLEPVTWSAGTKLGMLALRGYLVLGALLLIVKAVQLGRG